MTNPVSGGFQLTPSQGLMDIATYQTTPVSETAARQQIMDMIWQLMNEINMPSTSAAAFAQFNKLINGGFAVNQRVVSGTVTLAAGAYGHDRWKAGSGGCTYTFVTVNNVTTITITAGSLIQVIEGVNLYSGTYTLSWTGTAQGKIGAGAFGASGITGAATGGTNLNIEFNTGTLSKVQFNVGSIALPFQPRSFAEELVLCQRYFEKSYSYSTAPATSSITAGIENKIVPSNTIANGQNYGVTRFKVLKRTTPTITTYPFTTGTNTGRVSDDSSGTDLAASSGSTRFANDSSFTTFNGSGGSVTTVTQSISFHWSADAEL
jgi:hypothetical protein